MDGKQVLIHLVQAERHVSEGTQHVRRQRELVASLDRDGHDTTDARKLLAQFEELLTLPDFTLF